ncbi:hypothetical protein [Streptomyces pratensis]|uniref:hypothetical protein n=1 Tax=Streptomyces pratensis TaxID=1169025 RepID=UPI00363D0B5C
MCRRSPAAAWRGQDRRQSVEGVRAGSCRITIERLPEQEAPLIGVRLEIHAPASAQLQELAEEVRHRVLVAADTALGLALNGIDIRITDLLDVTDGPEGGGSR